MAASRALKTFSSSFFCFGESEGSHESAGSQEGAGSQEDSQEGAVRDAVPGKERQNPAGLEQEKSRI